MNGGFHRAPMIDWPKYPAEEREHVRLVCGSLGMLRTHANTFDDAVSLIEHCQQLKLAMGERIFTAEEMNQRLLNVNWQMIAARDAAFSMYHFQSSLRSVRDQLRHTPTLRAKVDTKALEASYRRIGEEFPDWKDMRDAIGHWADMLFSNDNIKQHWPEGPIRIGRSYDPATRRLTMTRNKKQISLDVTTGALERIESIMTDAWAAFCKADAQFLRR